ncbi:ribosomal protein S18 acetylase RimI-like enzyme [Kribbella amoyensis]|uniref:Ribosomal protein S18 acetylase RimI-like enzyme n=1 Tax=Kribbella amoyensis TaxID=996641 RepID=A0A561BMZ2_9ACTN|nr:GNAT family N-acetyltransferase [Kribbella amoyensis]TWD80256.1 ribosomal protein S18 acetylase RimI-like enzyme [Kribbella amoyensis]
MGFEVRPAVPADAGGIAGVWAAAMPQLVKTARGIEAELRVSGSRIVLVAAEGDRIVGMGNVYRPEAGEQAPRVRIAVQVPPNDRGRGIGTALADAVIAKAVELRAGSLLVVVNEDPAAKAFAEHRGFTLGREMSHSRAALASLPKPADVPDGLQLVSYEQLTPRQVWTATIAVADGDPSGLSHVPPYDDWYATDWNHPDLRRDLSFAVLDAERVVSFVTTTADPGRGVIWSNLTGTVPAYRGRGLAKVVKSHALARSREAGLTAAYTGNDAGNRPMLAVNHWLGYRVSGSAWTAEKTL